MQDANWTVGHEECETFGQENSVLFMCHNTFYPPAAVVAPGNPSTSMVKAVQRRRTKACTGS